MTRSTSVRALPEPKLIIFCCGELVEIVGGLVLAARQPNGGDEQRRAARGSDAPGELAAPTRIEQIVIALRHLIGRHQLGVVRNAEIAQPRAGPLAARIAVAFGHGLDHGRVVGLRQAAWTASSPTPVPSTTSATMLFARASAEILAMISSVSPRQNVIFTKGYVFMKASASGRSA